MGWAPRGSESACPSLSASPPRCSPPSCVLLGPGEISLALTFRGPLPAPFQGLPGLPALLCLAGAPLSLPLLITPLLCSSGLPNPFSGFSSASLSLPWALSQSASTSTGPPHLPGAHWMGHSEDFWEEGAQGGLMGGGAQGGLLGGGGSQRCPGAAF